MFTKTIKKCAGFHFPHGIPLFRPETSNKAEKAPQLELPAGGSESVHTIIDIDKLADCTGGRSDPLFGPGTSNTAEEAPQPELPAADSEFPQGSVLIIVHKGKKLLGEKYKMEMPMLVGEKYKMETQMLPGEEYKIEIYNPREKEISGVVMSFNEAKEADVGKPGFLKLCDPMFGVVIQAVCSLGAHKTGDHSPAKDVLLYVLMSTYLLGFLSALGGKLFDSSKMQKTGVVAAALGFLMTMALLLF